MGKPSRFWDRIAKRYGRAPVADQSAYEKKLEITWRHMKPGMNVFEFGCGTGSTAVAYAPHVAKIRAIDFSERMIEIARSRAADAGVTNVSFECADFDTLEVEAESIDMVMAHSILHLVHDRDAAIAKANQMLKPGGLFVTNTACLGDGMSFIKIISPVGYFLGVLPLLRVFTARELEVSLMGAGFEIEHNWQPAKGKAVFILARKIE